MKFLLPHSRQCAGLPVGVNGRYIGTCVCVCGVRQTDHLQAVPLVNSPKCYGITQSN